jgi:hypothetical protein
MDLLDQKLWKEGAEVVMNNLHIVAPLVGAAAFAGWWFRESQDKGTIGELRERIKASEARREALEERRQLADEKEQFVTRKNEELATQVESLKLQLSAGAATETIRSTVNSIDSTVSEISIANTEISIANTEISKTAAPDESIGPTEYATAAPPNLTFTKVLSAEVGGKVLPRPVATWNGLLNESIVQAAAKLKDCEALRELILANSVVGKKEDHGYRYLVSAGISVQGQDANSAWKAARHIIKEMRFPAKVVFAWYDNEKAAFPGETGKFTLSANERTES